GGFGVSVHWTLTSLETIVTEAEYGGPTPDGHGGPSVAEAMDGGKRPLVEVGVLRLDQRKEGFSW
ncbi:MAG: hypothetical protein QMD16_17765, partial [Desulfitobacteriaceae bacterium]|nr:hypothetical protein [Desulfitobacteriaceae bacterium]MDI6881175.1 hypothetical protein [Desulfitobacteriaceae bacterium]